MADDEWNDDGNNDFGDDGGFEDAGFEDAGFEDNDENWGDDFEVNDGFNNIATSKPKQKNDEDEEEDKSNNTSKDAGPQPWKCLECNHDNPGGLLCLKCSKPNLGELDRQRRIEAEKECKFWSRHYADVYLPLKLYIKTQLTELLVAFAVVVIIFNLMIASIIREIYAHEGFDRKFPDLKKWKPNDLKSSCESCTLAFESDTKVNDPNKCIREELTCHANICRTCFGAWIRSKIKDEDVLPHIRCPASDCDCSIPYGNFINNYHLSTKVFFVDKKKKIYTG
ncbi:hypothetical protein RFI_22859 [Reticulomyxa filosa]|uniref:Uncharacterized protein n=1 Tax=Reticulomyxa filosa TaxID=46433 RepID=X6MKY0_RETFI|nr:hypothetical protein RFI_22859 [Reticulomyxa filosa]|eukprot:ETO14499.1 hypothetical protein RFI_22859 [Reticulomyxa filosa]